MERGEEKRHTNKKSKRIMFIGIGPTKIVKQGTSVIDTCLRL